MQSGFCDHFMFRFARVARTAPQVWLCMWTGCNHHTTAYFGKGRSTLNVPYACSAQRRTWSLCILKVDFRTNRSRPLSFPTPRFYVHARTGIVCKEGGGCGNDNSSLWWDKFSMYSLFWDFRIRGVFVILLFLKSDSFIIYAHSHIEHVPYTNAKRQSHTPTSNCTSRRASRASIHKKCEKSLYASYSTKSELEDKNTNVQGTQSYSYFFTAH